MIGGLTILTGTMFLITPWIDYFITNHTLFRWIDPFYLVRKYWSWCDEIQEKMKK